MQQIMQWLCNTHQIDFESIDFSTYVNRLCGSPSIPLSFTLASIPFISAIQLCWSLSLVSCLSSHREERQETSSLLLVSIGFLLCKNTFEIVFPSLVVRKLENTSSNSLDSNFDCVKVWTPLNFVQILCSCFSISRGSWREKNKRWIAFNSGSLYLILFAPLTFISQCQ